MPAARHLRSSSQMMEYRICAMDGLHFKISRPPSRRLDLLSGTVDVWSLSLKAGFAAVEDLQQLLSPDELERARRFRFQERRSLFIVARAMLRILLSFYLHHRPASLVFHYGAKGKPYLMEPNLPDQPTVFFNMAHSWDRALCAIGSQELGVDIEALKPVPDWKTISRRFFSIEEFAELEKLQPEQQLAGFFACWTRKEAYLKATGDGLYLPLDKFRAGATPSNSSGVIEEDGKPAARWFFRDLRPAPGYVGALVTQSADTTIRTVQFDDIEEPIDLFRRGDPRPKFTSE